MKRRWNIWFALVVIAFAAVTVGGGCDCTDPGGVGRTAKISVSPPTLIYAAIAVGESASRKTEIENIGQSPLTITELKVVNEVSSAYSLQTKKDLPLELQPGEKISLSILYKPTEAGVAEGHVRIISDASNVDNSEGLTKVNLRSSEVTADISVTPNPVDFGDVKPEDGAEKTLTIENRGQADLEVSAFEFKNNKENELEVIHNLNLPVTIAPNESVEIKVKYSPKTPKIDDILYVVNNTRDSSRYEVRIVGKMAAPDIVVEPTLLSFGAQVGGQETKSFTIKNQGGTDLEVTGITLDATTSKDFSMPTLPTFPLIIKPGAEEKIEVLYKSSDLQNDAGLVKVASNDPDTPFANVKLEAKGEGCVLTPVPAQLHFVAPSTKKVLATNRGNQPCKFKQAGFSATSSKEFTFGAPPPAATTIAPNQKLEFSVLFKPAGGTGKGTLVIELDAPGDPKVEVPLTSSLQGSRECELKIQPASVAFGFVGTGRSRSRSIQITNAGWGQCVLREANINPNPSTVFAIATSLNAAGEVLPTGQTLRIDINYTPKAGTAYQGKFLIKSNDPKAALIEVPLVGTTGKLCLEALPDPVDFGSVKINCSSPNEKLDLFNICTATAQVTGIKFGANTNQPLKEFYFKQAPNTPVNVAYGKAISIDLIYAPKNQGTDIGSLEIANNVAGQSPVLISLRGQGVTTDNQKDIFRQQQKPDIDILFVIDDSCSMAGDQTNMANNFKSFIKWAATLQVNFHIGIITTDTSKGTCLRGTPKILTNTTPNLETVFSNNIKVGTSGSATEKGLETSYIALSTNLNKCNAGFYRQNASLSVIYVSDEKDYSQQPVAFYINFLKSLKGIRNPDKLRASAIGYQPKATCQQAGGCRYGEVARQLRGIYETITTANWGQTLSQLGAVTFGYRSQFFLSRPADPSSITVKVNGVSIPKDPQNGWTYDGVTNSITFAKGQVPAAGALIEVSYRALCIPPP